MGTPGYRPTLFAAGTLAKQANLVCAAGARDPWSAAWKLCNLRLKIAVCLDGMDGLGGLDGWMGWLGG